MRGGCDYTSTIYSFARIFPLSHPEQDVQRVRASEGSAPLSRTHAATAKPWCKRASVGAEERAFSQREITGKESGGKQSSFSPSPRVVLLNVTTTSAKTRLHEARSRIHTQLATNEGAFERFRGLERYFCASSFPEEKNV